MIVRLLTSAGLLALGYYIGREVGRTEYVREELRRARERMADPPAPPRPNYRPESATETPSAGDESYSPSDSGGFGPGSR
jgi:hypothetical protein